MKIPSRSALLDLAALAALVAVMAVLIFKDPFRIGLKIIDFLRLKFPIVVREPKLLFYSYIYIGSVISKFIAVALIIFLLAIRRISLDEGLGLKAPNSRAWIRFIIPFAVLAACLRIYYSTNPLMPNLPIRLVFPEAMVIANAIIISSLVFIAPVTEELIFRGYMFDVIRRNFGPSAAVILTSLAFALAHLSQFNFEPLACSTIFALGLIFGISRSATDSVFVPVALHSLYNLVYIVVGVFNYYIVGY